MTTQDVPLAESVTIYFDDSPVVAYSTTDAAGLPEWRFRMRADIAGNRHLVRGALASFATEAAKWYADVYGEQPPAELGELNLPDDPVITVDLRDSGICLYPTPGADGRARWQIRVHPELARNPAGVQELLLAAVKHATRWFTGTYGFQVPATETGTGDPA